MITTTAPLHAEAAVAVQHAILAGPCRFELWTGTLREPVGTLPAGQLLLTFPLTGDWLRLTSEAALSLHLPAVTTTTVASGFPTCWRVVRDDGDCVVQGTIGAVDLHTTPSPPFALATEVHLELRGSIVLS